MLIYDVFPSPAKYSSARDQLTNQNVAVKKIMKPFSTPVLAKRTYRELKLLKHLRHENVCAFLAAFLSFLPLAAYCVSLMLTAPRCLTFLIALMLTALATYLGYLSQRHLHLSP